MDERNEPPRIERETTIINTGGGRGGGSSAVVAIVVLLVLAVLAFVVFGGLFNRGDTDLDINIKTPDIELPKVEPPAKPSSSL